jgi:hypothetical protein
MWWEPASEADQRIADMLQVLVGRLREGGALLPFLPPEAILGVGSILLAPAVRAVLLLVDSRWDFTHGAYIHPFLEPVHDDLRCPHHYHRSGALVLAMAYRQENWSLGLIPLLSYFLPLSASRSGAHLLESEIDFAAETVLMFSEPPRPLFRQRRLLKSQGERGTFGLSVKLDGNPPRSCYTTAGHVVSVASVQSARTFGPIVWTWETDAVLARADCTSDPTSDGYDIAVIESSHAPASSIRLASTGSADPAIVGAQLRPTCAMYGAVSGVRDGFVAAALNVARTEDGIWWKNCWTLVGEGGWMVRGGDSGAPVCLHRGGKVLGHVVGGTGFQRRGRCEVGFVQDLSSQLRYLDERWGMRPT